MINTPFGISSPASGASFKTPITLNPILQLDLSSLTGFGQPQTAIGSFTSTSPPILGVRPASGERNRLLHSNNFSNASWTYVNANCTPVPDGWKLADSNTGGTNAIIARQTYDAQPGTTTFSIEAKSDQLNQVAIRPFGYDTSDTSFFNLDNGTVAVQGASHQAAITALEDGWYRASVSFTASSDLVGLFYIYAASSSISSQPLDGTSSIFIRRAQAEQAAQPSVYQETRTLYEVYEEGTTSVRYLEFDSNSISSSLDVQSNSWTIISRWVSADNFTITSDQIEITYSNSTVSAQVAGANTVPVSFDSVAVVAHEGVVSFISGDSTVLTQTTTSAYSNSSSNLTLSGSGRISSLQVYPYKLKGREFATALSQ